jgi:hypothetical protein
MLEMVLVCAMMVVVSAMAYPFLDCLSGKDGLTGKPGQTAAVDMLRSKLADARERAMTTGKAYRVAIVPHKGNIRVAPDSDDFWSGSGDGSTATVIACSLPHGSCFCPPDESAANGSAENNGQVSEQVAPASYQKLVTFLPNGTATEEGKVGVKVVDAPRVIVTVHADTGVVTTQEG